MKRCLHADDPVGSPVGDGQPRGVTCHGRGARCRQPSSPGGQLPLGDVHRHQPPRADQFRDQPILGTKPVTGIHDHAPGRKRGRQRRHEPAACGLGLILRTGPVPQPQVQPARRRREEEIRSNALVDARGGIPALPDHLGGMPHMLTRPAEHVLPGVVDSWPRRCLPRPGDASLRAGEIPGRIELFPSGPRRRTIRSMESVASAAWPSGSVIPPPPSTALSCSAIPPPPRTALSGSAIPPPPSTPRFPPARPFRLRRARRFPPARPSRRRRARRFPPARPSRRRPGPRFPPARSSRRRRATALSGSVIPPPPSIAHLGPGG